MLDLEAVESAATSQRGDNGQPHFSRARLRSAPCCRRRLLASARHCPPTTAPPSSQAAATSPPVESCPIVPTDSPGPTKSTTTIDYVDFIRFGGREYLSGISTATAINRTQLGKLITRSRCAFSELNNRTGKDPGPPRDGDTAFLAAGTPIYAVRGWAPACQLAAERDAEVFVYLATDPAANPARPARCTTRP